MECYNGFKGWPTSRNDGIARTSLTDNRCASFRPGDDFMIAHDRPRSLRTPEPRGIRSVVRLQDAPRNPANRARANAQQLRDSGLAICIKAGDRDFLNAHDGTAFIRLQCSRRQEAAISVTEFAGRGQCRRRKCSSHFSLGACYSPILSVYSQKSTTFVRCAGQSGPCCQGCRKTDSESGRARNRRRSSRHRW
jgi:hypothetical protein